MKHTESFIAYRDSAQELFDTVVLLCHAVPALKAYIKAVKGGQVEKLPDPDHFERPQPTERLLEHAKEYKAKLGKLILMSAFGAFEAYCHSLFKELAKFHGDPTTMAASARRHQARRSALENKAGAPASIAKLREYAKRGRLDKYRKHGTIVVGLGYPMPAERFAAYGVDAFFRDAENARSYRLPDLLRDGLGVPLSEHDCVEYHTIRDARNAAAHGEADGHAFRVAIAGAKHLREMALKSDKHVVDTLLLVDIA